MQHKFTPTTHLKRAALTLLALILTCATAWADNDPVSYIAANGSTQTCTDYTVLHTGDNVSNLPGGWYVVSENVEFNSQLYFSGSASIILCDGKTLTVNSGNYNSINVNYALTIYGQSGQSGTLNATCNSGTNSPCIYARNDITINGGIVSVNGEIGIRGPVITINRGTVTSTGNLSGIWATNNVIINGGKVRATGDSYGVMANNNITLGWTNYSDFINANSYYAVDGSVAIATGKTLYDDATAYSGTLTSDQIQAIVGQTLCPYSTNDFTVNTDSTEYTIHTATGWDVFCDALQDNNTWNHFSGKTVKLGADISITQSAGSAGNEFMGTFDGDGKTLTVDITETTTQGTAPFREIKGATIQNLVVTGSVIGTIHAAGLVGFARGADASTVNTITNCKVATNVTVTTPSGNNYHCGGVVGHAFHCTLNMSNTVYCGDITNSGNYVGGLQGWSDGNTINFSHCLFAGSYSGTASFHPVAVRNNNNATTADVSHVYYTVTPTLTNSSFIAADGTKTISRATTPATIGDQTQSLNFMSTTIYQYGICYNDLYYATIGLPSGGTDIYLIDNADDWLYFCEMLNDNDTWNRFSGKTVKLGADISVSRMAGNVNHDFTGTFDGNGHTLTFNHTAADNYCAPFRYVQGSSNTDHAVIQNLNVVSNITAADYRHPAGLIALQSGYVDVTDCNAVVNINCTKGTNNPHDLYPTGLVSQSNNTGSLTVSGCTVSGTISTDGKYAAGMVGIVQSSASVTNSVSSVTISSSTSGDGTHGGFVASLVSGRQLTIEGCVFNGKIVTTNGLTTKCGGFLGHNNTVGGTGATITNCLYAPAADPNTVSTDCATFGRNVNSDLINNCYYTTALGDAQGTQAYSISGGDYVTVGNAGTASSSYAVSGLDFYSVGLKCGDVLYAAENDVVSLTLGCTAPSGYYCTGYTATAGTLNGTTLTMPYGNVTINATLEQVPPVNYVDQNGETQQCTDYIWLTGTETTLGAAGQETWCVVHSTLNYSQGIQLLGNTHIILCDGAAMNIGTIDNPVSGSSFQEKVGFYGDGNNLSLYAQSGNTGALTIYSQSCSFFVKDLTIAGGNVNATSLSDVPVIFCDNLTVRRSSLEAHANYYAAIQANNDVTLSNVTANLNSSNAVGLICSNFAVDNSQLTVNARYQAIQASNVITLSNVTANINSSNGSGLVCSNFAVDHSQLTVTALYQAIQASNVITLGCTAATDFIKATNTSSLTGSYSGTVKIADGQTLYAGTNAYTGTLTDAERQAIGGQKLTNVAPPTYDYIGLDGTGATHTAVVIDADNMPTSLSGWYIVQGTVNYTNTINLGGDTHIILADNAVMNVTASEGNYGIQSTSGNNYSLFVYGQTGQSGELNVTSNSIACFISGGDITIAGGKVTASGRIIGLYAQYTNNNGGNVTIKNATVTATGTSYFGILSEYGGNITIDNSNVTATSTGSSGIYAGNGNITIDNSNVTATSTGSSGIYAENGNITIASGTVTASGSSTQFGIYTVYGSVTINGGQVMATGNLGIYTVNGSVTINGGQVSAIGNTYGIYAQNPSDNITLGWTNPTDYIYVNKYYAGGTLSIAEGKTFIDEDGQTYSSTIAMVSGAYAIDGKTLYPYNENAVPYLDENGQQRYCVAYTTLTGTETELGTAGQETWYVVDSDVSFTDLTINGDIHLILVDGKTMNLNHEQGFVTLWGQANLTIYGQTNGTGTLSSLGLISAMNITVNGGIVNVKGDGFFKEENFIPAIWCVGDMVINGGKVYAQGDMGIVVASMGAKSDDMTTYNFTLNGGQVTAIGMSTDMGIIATGNITLGWTNPTDYIYANKYYAEGTLSIASGKTFIDDDGNPYSGIIAQVAGAYAIDGKTLYPDCVVMKQVAGYEEGNGGWVFIASPVAGSIAPSEVHNLFPSADETTDDYDLYHFNQAAELEWENWKATTTENHPDFTTLVNGQGYLYATKNTKTLVFTGPFITDTDSVAVDLEYDAADDHKCWNLVGNPFPCEATINKPYYVLNSDGMTINPTAIVGGTIPPCTAVFVKGESEGDTVVFSRVSAPASSAPSVPSTACSR